MPTYYYSDAKIKFDITVICENCKNKYTYKDSLEIQSGKQFSEEVAQAKINQQISNIKNSIENKKFRLGNQRCPKCKYYQSWMKKDLSVSSFGMFFLLLLLISIFPVLKNIERILDFFKSNLDFEETFAIISSILIYIIPLVSLSFIFKYFRLKFIMKHYMTNNPANSIYPTVKFIVN
jgi:hypothetical protein